MIFNHLCVEGSSGVHLFVFVIQVGMRVQEAENDIATQDCNSFYLDLLLLG